MTRGNQTMLIELLQQLCKQQKQKYGEKHRQYFLSQQRLSMLFIKVSKKNKALKIMENIIPLQLEITGTHDIEFLQSQNILAISLEDHESALKILREVKNCFITMNQTNNQVYYAVLNNIASILNSKKEYTSAIKLFEEATELLLEKFGPTHNLSLIHI